MWTITVDDTDVIFTPLATTYDAKRRRIEAITFTPAEALELARAIEFAAQVALRNEAEGR